MPEEAVTIADRINPKCHQDWIEPFLVSTERFAEQKSIRAAPAGPLASQRIHLGDGSEGSTSQAG